MGIKLSEFQLNIICYEGHDGAIGKLLDNVNVELELIEDSVVLRIDSSPGLPFLIVSQIRKLKNTSLLESPLSELLAENEVGGALDAAVIP